MTAVIGLLPRPRRPLRLLESPQTFSRWCLRAAAAFAVLGVVGLGDRLFLLPFAGVIALFAALAHLADRDRLDDPVEVAAVEVAPVETPAATVVRTFELPATVGAARVALVGDFNGWDPEAHPMARAGDRFTVTVELEPGRTYRYRYLLDGRRWENDWAADAYAPNGFGSDDSVART